jgi:oxalate decarboxylase/phosphoglucose isomerase-like protein (cupin superfamily)
MSQQQQQQQQSGTAEGRVELTQQPRLWVSPAGAVSPLHYDKSHSFLVQVTGTKRMLFFSPDQLYRLYCYPDTHILRRRSRINLARPDFETFPLFVEAAALEVVLQPGDVVCFPSFWSHYTESLGQGPSRVPTGGQSAGAGEPAGCSMSITFRCQAADGV